MTENEFSLSKLLHLETREEESAVFPQSKRLTVTRTQTEPANLDHEGSLASFSENKNGFSVLSARDQMFKRFKFRKQKHRLQPIHKTLKILATEPTQEASFIVDSARRNEESGRDLGFKESEARKTRRKCMTSKGSQSVIGTSKEMGRVQSEKRVEFRKNGEKQLNVMKFSYLARAKSDKNAIWSISKTQTNDQKRKELETIVHEYLNGPPLPSSKVIEEIDEFLKRKPVLSALKKNRAIELLDLNPKGEKMPIEAQGTSDINPRSLGNKETKRSLLQLASEESHCLNSGRPSFVRPDLKISIENHFMDYLERENSPKPKPLPRLNLSLLVHSATKPQTSLASIWLKQKFYETIHLCIAKMEIMQVSMREVFLP